MGNGVAMKQDLPTLEELSNDPTASIGLRLFAASCGQRDPVDAANEAAVLATVLARRADNALFRVGLDSGDTILDSRVVKVVAVSGGGDEWTSYWGRAYDSDQQVAEHGEKVDIRTAKMGLFTQIQGRYRE